MKAAIRLSVPSRRSNLRAAFEIGCCLALVLCVLLSAALAHYNAVCDEICAGTLRLHILANSDTLEDQLLKLSVRDAVLTRAAAVTQNASNKEEAVRAIRDELPSLEAAARQALRKAHSGQRVRCVVEESWFAPRDYGSFRLPGGEYTALRVELGSAAGHNWFCVLYPALCTGASGAQYETEEQNALVFGQYEVRFALLDSARALWRAVTE